MKRTMIGMAVLLALALSASAPAHADTYFGFQVGIGNAPPPPRVAYTSPPRMERDARSQVQFLADDPGYDMFRYGSSYYICAQGYWYNSRNYRGPFYAIDVRRVPRQVFSVPPERWHHHPLEGPPGQMKRTEGAGDRSGTYFGFRTGIENAPPPPQVQYRKRPKMQRESGLNVTRLNDDPGYDMFQYGSWYYINSSGYWYRSKSYRGPFRVVDVKEVPVQVFNVPPEKWHHHPLGGPPGQMKKGR